MRKGPADYDRMHAMLQAHGVLPASAQPTGDFPNWDTETGHHFAVPHASGHGWLLTSVHTGDPSVAGLSVPLGHDDETAAHRVAQEMRHPETLGHLRDMWQRAMLNNDPTGRDYQARRVKTTTGEWINLDHYGDAR